MVFTHHGLMQPEFFLRLSASVQALVQEIEVGARLVIHVEPSAEYDTLGPSGQGALAVSIRARHVQLFVPSTGYFPDGAVRHELLHARRFLLEGVPKLVLIGGGDWNGGAAEMLGHLDNALEHLAIVPRELQLHPERRDHWEGVMRDVWHAFSQVPESERDLAACLHWSFMRHVLPGSALCAVATDMMASVSVFDAAQAFADRLLAAVGSKKQMVNLVFDAFEHLPRQQAGLEYLKGLPVRPPA